MLQKFEVHAVHTTLDDQLRSYTNKKLGGLDKYISRHNRVSAHAEVHLKEAKAKDRNRYACEVTLYLPHQTIVVEEQALNMFAAIDIVEAKLKQQLKRYKDTHASPRQRRHLLGRIRGKNPV